MVTVMRNGEEVKISKRAGSYVTLRDLIEWSNGETAEGEIGDPERDLTRGRDAVRFFLISRKADTEFVFDVDRSEEHTSELPLLMRISYPFFCLKKHTTPPTTH